ncbi:class I SAM-dependent methyltransferase [Chitinophaga sp. HK235]|uniref:class I SAM-dependent methyltransferase n=1 Tax=Chitinophaga sp. HK235 TaxID=2952571 RepID=UPI001BA4F79C|nr:class I SAM-dependent methyltransferase [Chitinophaga sp. HK235]
MSQYDHIANSYRAIAESIPYRGPEWYSLYTRLGSLIGKSVLDLGCGDGMSSRRLKSWGAARVVGVDVSEEMIRLARLTEQEQNNGVEYVLADVATMGRIGTFDVVTASYLLHYAISRTQLEQIARSVYENLRPGQSFITSNLNPQQPAVPSLFLPEHKLHFKLISGLLEEGSTIRCTLLSDGQEVSFDTYWYSWKTYQEVFRAAGFVSCELEPYIISAEEEKKYPPGFWDVYHARPWVIQLICRKNG